MRSLCLLIACLGLAACLNTTILPGDPYESTGPYAVTDRSLSIPHTTSSTAIDARLYYPRDIETLEKRPLVVMLPGFAASFSDYRYYSQHLASHGFIVLGMDFVSTSSDATIASHDDKAQQVIDAIDYVLNRSALAANLDSDRIASMGHSLGGKISFYAAAQDTRIDLVIALDPSNAGGPPCLISSRCHSYPVAYNPATGATGMLEQMVAHSLILRSQPDIANPEVAHNAYNFYYGSDGNGRYGVPATAYYYDLGATPHANYLPTLPTTTRALVKRYSVAMLMQTFDGIDSTAYLTGNKVMDDKSAGRIQGFSWR